MHIEIPHKLSKTQAAAQVKKGLEEARPKIGEQATIEQEEWVDDTLNFAVTVQGNSISGSLAVEDGKFILDAKLPLLWRVFEGRIKKAIEEQVAQLK